jgi:hypothetical protein
VPIRILLACFDLIAQSNFGSSGFDPVGPMHPKSEQGGFGGVIRSEEKD